MFRVNLSKEAQKALDKLDSTTKERMRVALFALEHNPFRGKKMRGKLKDCLTVRVWPYRIMYYVEKDIDVVTVIRIAHRQNVYRYFII